MAESRAREQREKTYRAMAYYRLSKERGAGHESDSIANQRKLILEYVKRHPEIELEGEACDDGYTGTNYDRPGFCSVLEAAREKRIDCVIVKDLSRLGREYIETGKYLEMIFPSLGVRFIAINDDVDSENGSAGDELLIPIKNIMNESYCRELSKKLRSQFRVQRANGEFLGAFARYGYRKSAQDKHRLEIDEGAAGVVRAAFSMKVQGYSQNAIAAWLNERGIPSPAAYKKSNALRYQSGFQRKETPLWSAVTVERILKDPVYMGTLVQGRRGTPNYKIKTVVERDPAQWVSVPNNHPAIVDPLLFSVVQELLARDTRVPPEEKRVLPLAGVLFCADCGSSMLRRSVKRGDKTFHYYVCSGHKAGRGCSSHSFAQDRLEAVVLHAMQGQLDLVAETEMLAEKLGVQDFNEMRALWMDRQLEQKEREIEKDREFRMGLYEALQDALIDREEYAAMRQKYGARIERAEAEKRRLREERQALLSASSAGGFLEQYLKFRGLRELSREAVATLIDKVYVYEDKRIRVEFNYRDELELLRRTIWAGEAG